MGCVQSSPEDKINRSIQKSMAAAKAENEAAIHLFLVGSGDSGKSTLVKQLYNLNTTRFADPAYRKLHYANVILSNLNDGAVMLVEQGVATASEEEKEVLQEFNKSNKLTEEGAQLMIRIFKDAEASMHTVQNLQDCFKVFSKQFVEGYPGWGFDPEWIPSVEDCIRARVRTTGVLPFDFEMAGRKFCVVDVGGQKAEGRKWIHKFEEMNAMIFVVAASEYDLSLFEDPSKNRLMDSLELFEQISNSEYLRDKPMLLFMNKRDLFVEKIKTVPLSESGIEGAPTQPFPDGAPEKAVEWLTQQFQKRREKVKTPMTVHLTCATDPENVQAVFDACKPVIFAKALAATGL